MGNVTIVRGVIEDGFNSKRRDRASNGGHVKITGQVPEFAKSKLKQVGHGNFREVRNDGSVGPKSFGYSMSAQVGREVILAVRPSRKSPSGMRVVGWNLI